MQKYHRGTISFFFFLFYKKHLVQGRRKSCRKRGSAGRICTRGKWNQNGGNREEKFKTHQLLPQVCFRAVCSCYLIAVRCLLKAERCVPNALRGYRSIGWDPRQELREQSREGPASSSPCTVPQRGGGRNVTDSDIFDEMKTEDEARVARGLWALTTCPHCIWEANKGTHDNLLAGLGMLGRKISLKAAGVRSTTGGAALGVLR